MLYIEPALVPKVQAVSDEKENIEKYATSSAAKFGIKSYSSAKKTKPVILGKSYHSENEHLADLKMKFAASVQGLFSDDIPPPLFVFNTPEA